MIPPVWYRFQSCFGAIPAAPIDGGIQRVGVHILNERYQMKYGQNRRTTQQSKESSDVTLSKENLIKHDVSTAGANASSTSVSAASSVAESERDVLISKSHDHLGRIGDILNEMKDCLAPTRAPNPPKLPRARATKKPKKKEQSRRKNRVNEVPLSSSATGTPETVRRDPSASDVNNNDVDNWQKVRSKRQKGKGKQKTVAPAQKPKKVPAKRPRPDVVVIKAKDPKSYASILQRLRTEQALQDPVGSNVNRIRRSATGDLLLELRKASGDAKQMCRALDEALGELATSRARPRVSLVEIRDLDEAATRDEILSALHKQLDGASELSLEAVKSLRKSYAGTQTAVVVLPVPLAGKLLKLGHLRVGWVNCRTREKRETLRCYRCWGFDHTAAGCKGPDRTKCCLRCGVSGHMAKECKSEPSCVLCQGGGTKPHSTMSMSCPLARKHLQGSVIDLTFASDTLSERVKSWRVSGAYTGSDHRAIVFEVLLRETDAPTLLRRAVASGAPARWTETASER
ncbi:unnamed protein product [Trichogramma brassicae]|uniref:CCHC-type domain-containing protein n=1 Tax=Trichogramma brassicae TaxID=86971 RepID=A0A6H5ISP7_9HYME|nr:unnamed protein product [Trichogramma brassicae]